MSWFTKLSGEEGWGTRGGRIFVAVVGEEVKGKAGMIIGWCMATMAYPPHLPDTLLSQLYLSAIYVHASYVTQGVGRQLVQYLATEAGKGHAELIRAECKRLPKLVQMHESWGFTPVRYTGWAEDYEDKMQLFHMDLRTDEEREQDEYVEDEDEEDE
ncbi:hypothetical protein DACRYDRAFT_23034 [Dacryopinax primogenitus]|uniref:N-acetyltransferase domain-containing protein n=1 Tax=Dacryopinax primogenitus (strain DJM 731) TaxID=1858805 RepID=M5FXV4_DACPD|nr:uncharacterized protein DACRYDRAFT_23034 [Dacryopinax primogenitus]EJU00615.1 hypothetical protein DACRYDRAFT_23034 [Dacryopinax primogenitus]